MPFATYTDSEGNEYRRKAKLCLKDESGETYCSSANQLVSVFKKRYPEVQLTQQKIYSYFDDRKMSRLRQKGLPEGVSICRL